MSEEGKREASRCSKREKRKSSIFGARRCEGRDVSPVLSWG